MTAGTPLWMADPFRDPRIDRYEIVHQNGVRSYFVPASQVAWWPKLVELAREIYIHYNNGLRITCLKHPDLVDDAEFEIYRESIMEFEAYRRMILRNMA